MAWAGVQQPAGGVRGHSSPRAGAGTELGCQGSEGLQRGIGWARGYKGPSHCLLRHAMRSLRGGQR